MNSSWTSGAFGGQPSYGLSNQQPPAWASRGLSAYGFGGPQGMTGGLYGLGASIGGAFGRMPPVGPGAPGQQPVTPAGYDDWAQSQGFGDDSYGLHKRQWGQQYQNSISDDAAAQQARLPGEMATWQQQAKDQPWMYAFDPNKGQQSVLAMDPQLRGTLPGWGHVSYYQDPTTGATADVNDLAKAQGQGTAIPWNGMAPGQQQTGGMDPGFAPAMGQQMGGGLPGAAVPNRPGYGLNGLQPTGGMDPGAAFIRR